MLESIPKWQKINIKVSYSCISTGKATLISVHVYGFHSRLKMKLSKVLRFYQVTFAQDVHAEHSRDSVARINNGISL